MTNKMTDCGLYIHVPFCERKCNYCDFYSIATTQEYMERYVSELCNELYLMSRRFPDADIQTVYLGGGTPSLLEISHLDKIFSTLHRYFSVHSLETTIEVNPNSARYLEQYPSFGIDRISIGVQSLRDETLRKLGRLHTSKEALQTLDNATKWFDNISVDLIIGADNTTDIAKEVSILSDSCQHISGYLLTVSPKTPLYKMLKNKKITIANEDETVDQYESLYRACREHGIYRYEVSNFARIGCEAKHNSGYWEMKPYLGVGPSAHSYYGGRRFYNDNNLNKYLEGTHGGNRLEKIERKPSKEDDMEETVMLSLRTQKGVNVTAFNQKFGVDFFDKYGSGIETAKKYLDISPTRVRILPSYFLLQNSVIIQILTD